MSTNIDDARRLIGSTLDLMDRLVQRALAAHPCKSCQDGGCALAREVLEHAGYEHKGIENNEDIWGPK